MLLQLLSATYSHSRPCAPESRREVRPLGVNLVVADLLDAGKASATRVGMSRRA